MDLYFEERQLYAQGLQYIAGVDEVGRGCLAGPVYAAAVILPLKESILGLNDSKKLTVKQRENLSREILQRALAVEIARVEVQEIDRINILHASLKAMALAISRLKTNPEIIFVDGKFSVPRVKIPQKTLIQGDSRSASIAAASIVAKVARDAFMAEQEKAFPNFSFAKHKGYGTKRHLAELKENGPTLLHRRSFAPVRDLIR